MAVRDIKTQLVLDGEREYQQGLQSAYKTVSQLGRQGQLYLGEPPTITEEWIHLHAAPSDIEPMTLAMCKAVGMGLTTLHELKNEDVDLVAEGLQKNA